MDVVTVVTFTIAGGAEDFLDDCHNVLLVDYFAVRAQGEIKFTGFPRTCPDTLGTVTLLTIQMQDAIPFIISAERTFFNTLGCFSKEDFNFSHCSVVFLLVSFSITKIQKRNETTNFFSLFSDDFCSWIAVVRFSQ